MFSRKLPFLGLVLFSVNISHAQITRNIYLGEGMDTLFDSGVSKTIYTDKKYTLLELLGYRTFRHEPVPYTGSEDINRAGLVLPAKREETLELKAEAVVGKNDNTCLIVYDATFEKITEGRSALLSVLKFLSRQEDQAPQEDPSSHIRAVMVTGKISLNESLADFIYQNNFNKRLHLGGLSGKVWYRGDSLSLQPIRTHLNKKGKIKRGYVGYSLTKKDTIYAAANIFNGEVIYYINKNIGDKEKLITIAYLFIAVCYFYSPHLADMTPD